MNIVAERILVNRFPDTHENFNVCISKVGGYTYLCIKSEGIWHRFRFVSEKDYYKSQ